MKWNKTESTAVISVSGVARCAFDAVVKKAALRCLLSLLKYHNLLQSMHQFVSIAYMLAFCRCQNAGNLPRQSI